MSILDLSSYGTWPRELSSTELEFHVRTECFFTANHRKFTTIMTTDYILVTLHYGCGSGADLFRAIMFFMTPKNCTFSIVTVPYVLIPKSAVHCEAVQHHLIPPCTDSGPLSCASRVTIPTLPFIGSRWIYDTGHGLWYPVYFRSEIMHADATIVDASLRMVLFQYK